MVVLRIFASQQSWDQAELEKIHKALPVKCVGSTPPRSYLPDISIKLKQKPKSYSHIVRNMNYLRLKDMRYDMKSM